MIEDWSLEKERILLKKAKKEPELFGEIYQFYFDKIHRYVSLKVSNDSVVANELVSNVFYKALVKLNRYDEKRMSFSPWLYKIALNEVRMYFRKNKSGNFLFRLSDMEELLFIDSDDGSERKEDLVMHISSLKEEELSIIELRFYESFSFKELGEVFNKSEEAIKMKTHRIIQKLKSKMIKP